MAAAPCLAFWWVTGSSSGLALCRECDLVSGLAIFASGDSWLRTQLASVSLPLAALAAAS